MKLVTIVGARPQFIKASAISRAIVVVNREKSATIKEVLIHTGQHYDKNMSDIFFAELGLRRPDYDLGVSKCGHGAMTGKMLIALELALEAETPDMVLVYGDTNSTLAGALAASKLNIPVVHVEAGLRSFNRRMPEEVNRIVTDHVSSLLFCPTVRAVENLEEEGIKTNVHHVGDVTFDVTRLFKNKADERVRLSKWGVAEDDYILCTIHRAENTDEPDRFDAIMIAISEIAQECKVVFPVHPRTRQLLALNTVLMENDNIIFAEPASYLEMIRLESSAKAIITDSGGVQKEAYFQGKACITLRDETEWVETVDAGVNYLCGSSGEKILAAWDSIKNSDMKFDKNLYGDGLSAYKIVDVMCEYFEQIESSL